MTPPSLPTPEKEEERSIELGKKKEERFGVCVCVQNKKWGVLQKKKKVSLLEVAKPPP